MKVSQQIVSQPSLPAILAEYGELHWSITVGKKPRGLWRPPLTVKIWNTASENRLNINPRYNPWLHFFSSEFIQNEDEEDAFTKCSWCSVCKRVAERMWKVAPVKWFAHPQHRHGKAGWEECRLMFNKNWSFFNKREAKIYLEWRPGVPDYSDAIDWFRKNVCEPVVEEYHRRLLEAYQSEPIEEEITVSSESVKIEKAKEELKKKPTRKLRVR